MRRWNTYKNAGKGQCRKVSAKLNGQKGGRKQEAVTIVNANDGSLKTSASRGVSVLNTSSSSS